MTPHSSYAPLICRSLHLVPSQLRIPPCNPSSAAIHAFPPAAATWLSCRSVDGLGVAGERGYLPGAAVPVPDPGLIRVHLRVTALRPNHPHIPSTAIGHRAKSLGRGPIRDRGACPSTAIPPVRDRGDRGEHAARVVLVSADRPCRVRTRRCEGGDGAIVARRRCRRA